LINIVDNALKYSSNGAAEITIKLQDRRPLIIIRDNGPGIPEKEQDLVYDLFYRGSNIRHIPGQGIGLSLTRQILEFCKVNISIHSGPEVGTEVKLAF